VIASPPSREELLALAEKYETLLLLRRARTNGEPIPERAYFKDLADRFPGVLHELDTLPIELLDARARTLQSAAETNLIEPWMAWMIGFHALMRAALRIRIRSLKEREPTEARALDLAADARNLSGALVDVAFVRSVLRPPRGRITAAVYEALSSTFGEPSAVIRAAIFPKRRDRLSPPVDLP